MATSKPCPGDSSLGGHLDELRRRIALALAGVAVALVPAFLLGGRFVRFVLLPFAKACERTGQSSQLQSFGPADTFLVYLKSSLLLAAALSLPWVVWQAWRFVAPGLHADERRRVGRTLPLVSLLFGLGVFFFLGVVAPWMFGFFLTFNAAFSNVVYQPGIMQTTDVLLTLALVFGVAFQLPVFMVIGAAAGIVGPDAYRAARRYVVLASVVAGAVLTPPDVLSQVALALPLYVLYEIGILLSARVARRRRD